MTPNRLVFTGSVILYLLIATWTGDAAAAAILQATYVAFIIWLSCFLRCARLSRKKMSNASGTPPTLCAVRPRTWAPQGCLKPA
jgi:hypothetical protein